MRVEQAAARPIAAARGQASAAQIPTVLIALLDRAYAALDAQRHVARGRNVAIYDAHGSIEAGVEVGAGFVAEGDVVASATPAGRVATATHVGPYAGLGSTHAAIRAWCRDNGHAETGVSWEVYGDWDEDGSRLVTDVYVLLQAD